MGVVQTNTITDIAALEASPGGAVILSAATKFVGPRPFEKADAFWMQPGTVAEFGPEGIPLPATVLHVP